MSGKVMYLFIYDLNMEKDYKKALKALKSKIKKYFPHSCHPMRSTFLIITELNIDAVLEKLEDGIDTNDCMLITRVGKCNRFLFSSNKSDSEEIKNGKTKARQWLEKTQESVLAKQQKTSRALTIKKMLNEV